MTQLWVSNWKTDPSHDGLRAVLDPEDASGTKNEFIHRVHVKGLRRAVGAASRTGFRTAVDFGCGIGRLTPTLLEFADTVVGIDVEKLYLERARAAHAGPRTLFVAPHDVPPIDRPVLVVCFGVPAHLREVDVPSALRRLRSLAGDDATLILSERVRRAPGFEPVDIDSRDRDWYLGALRDAGWLPQACHVIRRAWSIPLVAGVRTTRRLPRPVRGGALALWSAMEVRRAPHSARGDYVEICVTPMRPRVDTLIDRGRSQRLDHLRAALPAAAASQAANAFHLVRREPVTTPPLKSSTLGPDDVAIARRALRSPRSPEFGVATVARYERSFARWNGSAHACSFASGRVALSAAIDALELRPGDTAIVPAYTCFAVPNAFRFAGVEPVYCDIEDDTFGLDVACVERAISDRTRAIVVQHLYGLACRDYARLIELARRRGVAVIEDCAQATGAEMHGTKVGNLGDVAVYSSGQSKVFDTCQGGIAVTDDDRLAARLRAYWDRARDMTEERLGRLLYTHVMHHAESMAPGRWWRRDVVNLRYGHLRLPAEAVDEEHGVKPLDYEERMAGPVARLGLNQLRKLEQHAEHRRDAARVWARWCDQNGWRRPLVAPATVPVFPVYPVLVTPEMKRRTRWAFEALGARIAPWFDRPPVARAIEGNPMAAEAYARCVCPPTSIATPMAAAGRRPARDRSRAVVFPSSMIRERIER